MLIKDIRDCEEFVGADETVLREVLRPVEASLPIRYSLAHATVKLAAGQLRTPTRRGTS